MSDQDYIDMKSGFVPHYRKADVPYEEIRKAQEKSDQEHCREKETA